MYRKSCAKSTCECQSAVLPTIGKTRQRDGHRQTNREMHGRQGRLGANTRGGSKPDFESKEIYCPTKLSIFLSSYWTFCLPLHLPLSTGLPAFRLSCLSNFFLFSLFPIFFLFFFLSDLQSDTIYSLTLIDPPDPPSRTPLMEETERQT